jgi:hypothetical protein
MCSYLRLGSAMAALFILRATADATTFNWSVNCPSDTTVGPVTVESYSYSSADFGGGVDLTPNVPATAALFPTNQVNRQDNPAAAPGDYPAVLSCSLTFGGVTVPFTRSFSLHVPPPGFGTMTTGALSLSLDLGSQGRVDLSVPVDQTAGFDPTLGKNTLIIVPLSIDTKLLLRTGACASTTTLCIDDQPGDARFQVKVHYHTQQSGGRVGDGQAIYLSSLAVNHGGMFWFFGADNPEMLIKVLNGCAVNGKFWVFYSAGTNVGLTTTVLDTKTGVTQTYRNADLTAAPPVQDTSAFSCPKTISMAAFDELPTTSEAFEQLAGASTDRDSRSREVQALQPPSSSTLSATGSCVSDDVTLCISDQPNDRRFKVQVHYQTVQGGGRSGDGHEIPLAGLGVNHGGLFWFFGADNPEMLIKVLNACALDGKFWVFYSAGTNVGLNVTVTDTVTGTSVVYKNTDLKAAPPVQDTSALPCD